jgi:curli production assembly/transport component CsgF
LRIARAMFETGSEALPSSQTITADNAGTLASTRDARGARFRAMWPMSGIVAAIENNVRVLLARHSLTYGPLLAYGAGFRLTTIFSPKELSADFSMRMSNGVIGRVQASRFNFQRGCIMGTRSFSAAALIAGILLSSSAFATEQVYRPVSPTFGGNALNGNFLLSTAQAQGNGAKSGQQSPDLSGLNNALSGIGGNSQQPVIIIGGSGQTTIPSSP